MSGFWSWYVILIVAGNIVGCAWLLWANRKARAEDAAEGEALAHEFDGIEELNNPLPAWWTWLFWITLIFSIVYLVRYPGLGNLPGWLGWTSVSQWEAEVAKSEAKYGPIFAAYYEQPIPALLSEQRAIDMGGRLFANNCSPCHGSDAQGGKGYPNLTDGDWLSSGEPEAIEQTITVGRNGIMPPMGAAIGGEQAVKEMAQYVISLSGREHDAKLAEAAAPKFATICAACHTPAGTGNPAIGAPNLTDDIWLHGGRVSDIEYQITNGRTNVMPAHKDLLGKEKIHLLALYVYSLSKAN
jgi:cytochrome c oxidase cbb3-type subunit 3